MNGCQNFPEVYSFFHGFVMSIITQFPNHVAYRISLLQTALPAFILKQGREIYFWVDFQCKRKHNAKLVLIKRSLRDFWFYTLLSIHAQYTYTRKTITRPKPEWSVTHFDTLYHPVFTRVVKIASLHPSIGTRFDDCETVTPDKWHFAAHFIFFFFFFWWPRFFIVSCCSLALTSGPVSFEVKWELYTHVIFFILAYCKITG